MGEIRYKMGARKRVQSAGLTLPGLNVLSILRQHGDSKDALSMHAQAALRSGQQAPILRVWSTAWRAKAMSSGKITPMTGAWILAKITVERRSVEWLTHYLPGHYTEIQKMFSKDLQKAGKA